MTNISDLKFDEHNFNKHTQKGMGLLEKSLQQFGAGRSILIDKDNNIIAGNGIVEAAGQIGLDKVKIIETDGTEIVAVKRTDVSLDSDQGREMALADNATAAADLKWDKDNIAGYFEPEDVEKWDLELNWDSDTEIEEDEAPEVDESEPAKSELGKVYQLGEHRLMCGDSTDAGSVAILMDGQKADLWLTDPPYNVDIGCDGESVESMKARHRRTDGATIQGDKQSDGDFRDFLCTAYKTAMANIKKGGVYYIWIASTELYNFIGALFDNDIELRQVLVWNKNRMVLGRQDYQWKHELCLYGWREGTHNWYNDRTQTTVIDWERPTKSDEHPTMKPVGLFAYQIGNSSKKGDLALDTFGGSGTTLIACEQLGRKCYMMELDPHYCDVIRKRWWKFTHDGDEEGWEEGTPVINEGGK